jgi:signal transduction histidine kinase
MNGGLLPDIPRIYTAIAEWAACVVYILPLKKRLSRPVLVILTAAMLLLQIIVQIIAGKLPITLWIPSMATAVLFMLFFIYSCCDISAFDAGYCAARAFITAEFAASLGWQLYCYFIFQTPWDGFAAPVVLMSLTYSMVFVLIFVLEFRRMPHNMHLSVHGKELITAITIAVTAFTVSNIYFVVQSSVFADSTGAALFFIRTLVDFSGLTVLFIQQEQRNEMRLYHEVKVLDNVLYRQYEQYKKSKGSIEILNRKYHDLKHQIAVIRAEDDLERRESYLAEMDQALNLYSAQIDTGNKVLDIVLTEKSMYCAEHGINITCVVDGGLLHFMNAMDICTIFGNALDNAIESAEKLDETGKRIIRVAVYSQNELVMIRFENYMETTLAFEDSLPRTTKNDKNLHGYGIKGIRYATEKYGGNMTIHTENNWFVMCVLIPV